MKFYRYVLVCVLLLNASAAFADKVSPDLRAALNRAAPNDILSAIIYLPEQVDLDALNKQFWLQKVTLRSRHETVVRALQLNALQNQAPLLEHLSQLKAKGDVLEFENYWLVNAIHVKANREVLDKLGKHAGIETMYLDYEIESIKPVVAKQGKRGLGQGNSNSGGTTTNAPEIGLVAIRAPEVWNLGITGEGILVGSLDTGVQGSHPAVASRWAGLEPAYAGNPTWAWFDPVTNTTFPTAFGSHGTHTMGTICGGAPGLEIGVAPGAHWIHAAVIDRVSISRTISDAILSFQWMVDPDGDPQTNFDVPCACCNSWGLADAHGVPDCNQTFWSFLDACEAAGIVMVFAAGNEGGGGVRRPADRATTDYKTLAIAAVDARNNNWPIASFSSRGPTFCTPNGSAAIKPDIAAPGVSVRSSVPNNSYANFSGTSMATPHITGVVALIRQANPNLGVDEIKQIMFDTAVDRGQNGEDNSYGWGMVDAFEAVQIALSLNVQSFPVDMQINEGALVGGDVSDLLESDDQYVRVATSGIPTNVVDNNVEIEITGNVADESPSELTLVVEAAINLAGKKQRIHFFNYDTANWDEVDIRDASTTDTEVTVTISSNAGRYIQNGTKQVKARIGNRDVVGTALGWNGRFDLVFWTTTQ